MKTFAIIGVAGFLLAGSLAVFMSISAARYVAEVAQTSVTQEKWTNLKATLSEQAPISLNTCWQEARSLLALQPWIEKPVGEHLLKLKVACLTGGSAQCEGDSCKNDEMPAKEKGGITT